MSTVKPMSVVLEVYDESIPGSGFGGAGFPCSSGGTVCCVTGVAIFIVAGYEAFAEISVLTPTPTIPTTSTDDTMPIETRFLKINTPCHNIRRIEIHARYTSNDLFNTSARSPHNKPSTRVKYSCKDKVAIILNLCAVNDRTVPNAKDVLFQLADYLGISSGILEPVLYPKAPQLDTT